MKGGKEPQALGTSIRKVVKASVAAVDVGTQYLEGVQELLNPTYIEIKRVSGNKDEGRPTTLQARLAFLFEQVQLAREKAWSIERQLETRFQLSKTSRNLLSEKLHVVRGEVADALDEYRELNVADECERKRQRGLEALKWQAHKDSKNRARWRDEERQKALSVELAAPESSRGDSTTPEVRDFKRKRPNPVQRRRLRERLGLVIQAPEAKTGAPKADNCTSGQAIEAPTGPGSPAPSVGVDPNTAVVPEAPGEEEKVDLSNWE